MVILSSLCFAVVPTAAKASLDLGSSLFVLLFSRCLIGLFLLTPMMVFQKKSVLIPRRFILPILFSSLVSVSLIASTYHAIEVLDIAIVLIILYSFPVGIAIITFLRKEEQINLPQWLCLIIVICGLTIVVSDGTFQGNIYGFMISFISLVFMILFMHYSSKIADQLGSQKFNLHINVWSLLFLLIAYLAFDFTVSIPSSNTGKVALFYNGLFYILSYTLFYVGSKEIGITRASILSSTEPLFATFLALITLNQYLTFLECFGFVLVITALYGYERIKGHQPFPRK